MTVGTPCIDSNSQVSKYYSALELNNALDCPLDAQSNLKEDPRFTNVDPDFNLDLEEWEHLQNNGVADILSDMYEKYPDVGEKPSRKSNNQLNLFARNTIPWSLKCEIEDGLDRQYGLDQFTMIMDTGRESLDYIATFSLVSVMVVSVLSFCGFCGILGLIAA
jgi:hypothetical protein